jgi:hypothetical protein
MSKKKPIKTELKQDLSDMTEVEMKEFKKKLIDAFAKAYKIPKKYLDSNQNKDDNN